MTHLNQKTLVSLIIPVFNGEKFILKALETVFKQNYPNLEIIAVNDGSTDGTLKILQRFENNMKIISQENKGPAAARNIGIRGCRGPIVAFLDADDFWTDNRLSRMVDVMESDPTIEMVRGLIQAVSLDGQKCIPQEDPALYPFLIGSAIYRRNIFERVGLFDPELRFGEDMDWLVRAKEEKINIKVIDDVTLLYHRHKGNITRVNASFDLGMLKVIRKKLKRNKFPEK